MLCSRLTVLCHCRLFRLLCSNISRYNKVFNKFNMNNLHVCSDLACDFGLTHTTDYLVFLDFNLVKEISQNFYLRPVSINSCMAGLLRVQIQTDYLNIECKVLGIECFLGFQFRV